MGRITYLKFLGEKRQKGEQNMKNYERPEIKDIKVNLEDIIAVSNNGSTSGGGSSSLSDLFGGK
jgi:hypothetical protein